MSSKRAYYYSKRFNWKEINNLFCYDVKHPERLSRKQQILRLFKNCTRRLWEMEMIDVRSNDLHTYVEKRRQLKEDFAKLRNAKAEEEVNNMLEKYEFFMENTYTPGPLTHDNVPYEWRHGKGLQLFQKEEIESDIYGYYDNKLLKVYPTPLEWQFRDEYPTDDALIFAPDYCPNGWDSLQPPSNVDETVKTPEQFQQEIDELRLKYKIEKPNMWENRH